MSKYILITLGLFFVCLAVLGVVLPVLPTTPFLIVAAACFAKSSNRLYGWLLANRIFGSLIRNWEETRSIPKNAKFMAITLIILAGGFSVFFVVQTTVLQWLVGLFLFAHIVFIAHLRTTESLVPKPI